MNAPRVVIGAPVYNHASEFREAIESILSQTYNDFHLVIVDDCSTDGTDALAREYAAGDARVEFVRNERRLGMIDNWRRAFEVSLERWPDAEYFAWASDHDVWHPRWLSRLVAELDAAPEAVLAYPLNSRIGPDSQLTDKRPWRFDTRGITGRGRRFRLALRHMSAGNMIYGLARARDVKACGVFRHVLVPDRLLLMELSFRGEFRQVQESLWFRRWYGNIFSLGRQRTSFFPNGRPLYAYVPWWISHATTLGWVYGIQGQATPAISRVQGVGAAVVYFFLAGLLHLRQQLKQFRVDLLERATFLKPAYQWLRRARRGVAKRLGLGDAMNTARKNFSDAGRRQRIRAKMGKRVRRMFYALLGGASRLTARATLSIPVVGPRVMPWLLREQLQISIGAAESLRLQRTITRLRSTTGPVLLGPFLAEPEFEVLYWIPFLRWLQGAAALDPARCTIVSRGGVASWYAGLADHAVDALSLTGLSDLRTRQHVRWGDDAVERDLTISALDTRLISAAIEQGGLVAPVLVHPIEMQPLFRHVWRGTAPIELFTRHIVRQRLAPPPIPDGLTLPRAYVAVRFAFGPAFPDTIANQRTARALIESLALQQPVVLLNTGFSLDGLEEFDPGPLPNVSRIDVALGPANSWGVLSAVLGHATAFVGAFGGFGTLATCYGVPGLSVYAETPGVTGALIDDLRRTATALETSAVCVHVRDLDTLALGDWTARHVESAVHARG